MTNLKALSPEELTDFILSQDLPSYRAKQVLHWIYDRKAIQIEEITELSRLHREELSRVSYISNLKLLERRRSADGTEKYLFSLEDSNEIETVLIPGEKRLTLCISSQAGCSMGCSFCLTARVGFIRNLLPHEIVDQVISAQRLADPERVSNIVFMGMGEPLMNLDNVAEAILRINRLLNISKRRITLSTSGIIQGIKRLPDVAPSVNLAISLNATTDSVRSSLMPVNKRYPVKKLLEACRNYPLEPFRKITFEYVLIEGINDSDADAKRLVSMLKQIPSKVNLIPLNPFEGTEFNKPGVERALRFQNILNSNGLTAFIRKSKGEDISAACGQLKAGYKPLT